MANKVNPREMQEEATIMRRVDSYLDGAYLYEDEMSKAVAMSCVPQEIQDIKNQTEQIKALLKWFKHDFFKWCDKPECAKCGSNKNMETYGDTKPTVEDTEFLAFRIESYRCKDCL